MRSYNAVPRRLLKYMVLLVIITGCEPPDAPDQARELPTTYTETITLDNGQNISFKMMLVRGGTFAMGSPKNEPGHKSDEQPAHQVRIDPFYLCTTETTIEFFMTYYQDMISPKTRAATAKPSSGEVDAITGPTPVYGDLTMGYTKKHPAVGMTWHNAATFCLWLSKETGRKYRLPTEAEWEYACRAGAADAFVCGNDPNQLSDFAWYKANSDSEPHEVGLKKPNAFGLHDMAGNVREWVTDFYNPKAYGADASTSPIVDPQGPTSGKVHVARGGDYSSPTEDIRCAARAFEEQWWRSGDPQIPKSKWWLPQMDMIGFRIAASVEPE